jgi:hypothetical protein
VALGRARDDHGRLAGWRRGGLRVGGEDLLQVVAVDLHRMPAEPVADLGQRDATERLGAIEAVRRAGGPPVLLKPVEVDDRGQVGQPVAPGPQHRLAHHALL